MAAMDGEKANRLRISSRSLTHRRLQSPLTCPPSLQRRATRAFAPAPALPPGGYDFPGAHAPLGGRLVPCGGSS